jgi:hypothetical protein
MSESYCELLAIKFLTGTEKLQTELERGSKLKFQDDKWYVFDAAGDSVGYGDDHGDVHGST